MRFIGSARALTRADAEALIEGIRAEYAEGTGRLAVERLDDGVVVGRVGLFAWDRRVWAPASSRRELGEHGELELGWALVRSAWGRGYASEAAAALRDHAFRAMHEPRLISVIHPENHRSRAVAERLGATLERRVETRQWGPADVYVHRPDAANLRAPGKL
jgi:RimJ/RimL family protein N-acetyltransferase